MHRFRRIIDLIRKGCHTKTDKKEIWRIASKIPPGFYTNSIYVFDDWKYISISFSSKHEKFRVKINRWEALDTNPDPPTGELWPIVIGRAAIIKCKDVYCAGPTMAEAIEHQLRTYLDEQEVKFINDKEALTCVLEDCDETI